MLWNDYCWDSFCSQQSILFLIIFQCKCNANMLLINHKNCIILNATRTHNQWLEDRHSKKEMQLFCTSRMMRSNSSFTAWCNSGNKNFAITSSYYLCSVRRTNWIVARWWISMNPTSEKTVSILNCSASGWSWALLLRNSVLLL